MKRIQKKPTDIRCENINSLEFENLLEEDLDDIENFLDSYVVGSVDECKIDATIEVLRSYMPVAIESETNKNISIFTTNNIQSILKLIKLQIEVTNKFYWIASLILVLYGSISITRLNIDLVVCSSIVAPIPILLGVVELIKGRSENVWELELSYKYSLRETILAKSIIIIAISMCISIIMSVISINVYSQINLLKIISVWLIPMCIISSISFIIVSIYRSINSIFLCTAIWILSVSAVAVSEIYKFIIKISNLSMLIILGICIVSMMLSLIVFYKNSIDFKDNMKFDL